MLFFFLAANAASAKSPSAVTGQDWLLMSQAEKMDYISSAMAVLQKHGVSLAKSPDQYVAAVDQLSDSPKMLSVNATNILASYVYETEPASRRILGLVNQAPSARKAP